MYTGSTITDVSAQPFQRFLKESSKSKNTLVIFAHLTAFANPDYAKSTPFANPVYANSTPFANPVYANLTPFANPVYANSTIPSELLEYRFTHSRQSSFHDSAFKKLELFTSEAAAVEEEEEEDDEDEDDLAE